MSPGKEAKTSWDVWLIIYNSLLIERVHAM